MIPQLLRTTPDHPALPPLIQALDAELRIRDGDDHPFYAQFNTLQDVQHIVLAFVGEVAVGCGALKLYSERSMEIKRMFVQPAFRGKGIASRILRELEDWTATLQFERCILETGIHQHEAIGMYQKNGYQRIPNYDQYIGVDTSICMEKLITNYV